MVRQVFFIHGGNAYSRHEDFLRDLREKPLRDLPWLERTPRWSDRLREDLGPVFELFAPAMPNKQNAKYDEWKVWFERYHEHLRDGVVLVGWSLGGAFLIKYLSDHTPPFAVRALVLLAAPFYHAERGGEDGGDFLCATERVGEVAHKAEAIFILHSNDDTVVPFAHADLYKKALPEATLLALKGRGHFLVPELPELLELLRGLG